MKKKTIDALVFIVTLAILLFILMFPEAIIDFFGGQ